MSLFTFNPTANTTPDPGQGGLAVTGNINTGHGSTNVSAAFNGSQTKTCVWQTFSAGPGGQITSVTLKFDWSENGSIAGAGTSLFQVQYSINGGAGYTTIFGHANVTSLTNSSSSVSLSAGQDLTQVRVRDLLNAAGNGDVAGTADLTTSVSNIRIEVVTVNAQVIMCI